MPAFDSSLLEDLEAEGLQAGELQLNELTLESVQHTCAGGGPLLPGRGAAVLLREAVAVQGPWLGAAS